MRRLFSSRPIFSFVAAAAVAALAGCGDGSSGGSSYAPLAGQSVARAASSSVMRNAPTSTSPGPHGFGGMRVGFEHSLICDNGVLIGAYAKKWGITTIYVPVAGDDVASLENRNPTTIKNLEAMTSVAKVFFVTGDSSWLATPTTVPPDAAALARIAAANPRVAGVLYTVDPETAANWNTRNRQSVVSSYFTLVATLQSAPGAASFKTSLFLSHSDFAKVPYAGSTSQPPPTMLQQLQSESGYGGTVMIVPGNSESAQYADLQPALSSLTKPFTIEASTSKYGPNTYYGEAPSTVSMNLRKLSDAVTANNSQLAGIEVNGWNDLYNGLQTIFPQPPVYTGTLATGPLVPAAGTTYLGAYVDPQGPPATPRQTAAFETSIGRKLAYNMHFYGWKEYFPTGGDKDDVANGRIPLDAWNCGDSDANVANGVDDAIIVQHAQAIKAFGSPIFIRWFWEMNLNDTNNPPRMQCYDAKSDLPDGYFSPVQYIRAWTHIRSIFAQQGVTNVIWLWCVANAHGGPSQYYPGDSEVDWVGMDDYDTNDVSMHDTFFILANELSQFQEKPFMITETGAHADVQSSFLDGGATELQTNFPWARAVGYLDAQGSFQNWVLTSGGLTSFATFANTPYMSAVPPQ